MLLIFVDFSNNNKSVYYDSCTVHYSTFGIPVLDMETAPPRVQPQEGSPRTNHSDWCLILVIFTLVYITGAVLFVGMHVCGSNQSGSSLEWNGYTLYVLYWNP